MDYNKLIKVTDSSHGVQKGRRMLKRAKHVADATGDKVNIHTDIEGIEVGKDDDSNRIIKTRDEKGNDQVIKVNKQNEVVNDGCCGGKKSSKKKPVKKVEDSDPFNFYPNHDESKQPTHRVNYYNYRGASTSSPAIFNSDEEAVNTAKSEAKNRGRQALGVVVQRYKDRPDSKYSDLEEVYRDDPYNVVRDSATAKAPRTAKPKDVPARKPHIKDSITDEDTTIVNGPESGSTKYRVGLWWGSGYLLDLYTVYAFSDEEALNNVVAWIDKNDPKSLETTDRYAEELRNELASDNGIDVYEAEELPEFYESYMYVDATMEGASQPHYIYSENLMIREVKDVRDSKSAFKKDVRTIRLNDNCQTDRQAEFSISPEAIYGILTEGESSVKIPNNGMNVNEYAKSCIKVMQGIAKDCGNKLPSIQYSIVGDEICFKTK